MTEPVAWLVHFKRKKGVGKGIEDVLPVLSKESAAYHVMPELITKFTPLYTHPAPAPFEHTAADATIVSATNTCKPSEGAAAGVPDVAGLIKRVESLQSEYDSLGYDDNAILEEAATALAALQSREEKTWHLYRDADKFAQQKTERIKELEAWQKEATQYLTLAANYTSTREIFALLAKAREVMG